MPQLVEWVNFSPSLLVKCEQEPYETVSDFKLRCSITSSSKVVSPQNTQILHGNIKQIQNELMLGSVYNS